MAAPDLSAAWDAIIAEQRLDDIDALQAQGWMTAADYAARAKVSDTSARSRLGRLVGNGVLEKKNVRVSTSIGVRALTIYRPLT